MFKLVRGMVDVAKEADLVELRVFSTMVENYWRCLRRWKRSLFLFFWGIPPNPSSPVMDWLRGESYATSWLHPDEVVAALDHHCVREDLISLEMRCVLHILAFFRKELGDDRVRFVFEIE